MEANYKPKIEIYKTRRNKLILELVHLSLLTSQSYRNFSKEKPGWLRHLNLPDELLYTLVCFPLRYRK